MVLLLFPLARRRLGVRLIVIAALLAGLVRAGLVALLFEVFVAEALLRFGAVRFPGACAGAVFDAVAGLGAIAVLAGGFDLIEDVDVLFLCTGGGDGGAVLLDRVFDDEAIFALRT